MVTHTLDMQMIDVSRVFVARATIDIFNAEICQRMDNLHTFKHLIVLYRIWATQSYNTSLNADYVQFNNATAMKYDGKCLCESCLSISVLHATWNTTTWRHLQKLQCSSSNCTLYVGVIWQCVTTYCRSLYPRHCESLWSTSIRTVHRRDHQTVSILWPLHM